MKDKIGRKSIYHTIMVEGLLMGVDIWCEQYINIPIQYRYKILTPILSAYYNSRLVRICRYWYFTRRRK